LVGTPVNLVRVAGARDKMLSDMQVTLRKPDR
jgi:hypothetical protein